MPEKLKWEPKHFSRRAYAIEGDDLEKAKRIRVKIEIDGHPLVDLQIREPGIIAVISRPAEQGIAIEIVEPGGVRYLDSGSSMGERRTGPPEPWQVEQLGLQK